MSINVISRFKRRVSRVALEIYSRSPKALKLWCQNRVFDSHDLSRISVVSSVKTLEKIMSLINGKITGGYLRFGDGDIFLMAGQEDLCQPANKKLALEMREAFEMSDRGIIKSLPINSDIFGFEHGMVEGKHKRPDEECICFLKTVYPYFIGEPIFSAVALHYCAEFNPDICISFLRFLKKHNPIIIGNKQIPPNISFELLNAKAHIKTPEYDAYSEIDSIESEFDTIFTKEGYQVVIVSMGCSGRVLTKRLLRKYDNIFVYDFGSLMDALCGKETRTWIRMSREKIQNIISTLSSMQKKSE